MAEAAGGLELFTGSADGLSGLAGQGVGGAAVAVTAPQFGVGDASGGEGDDGCRGLSTAAASRMTTWQSEAVMTSGLKRAA